jgi:DNA-directed RNA polymerase omega subunit
MLLKPSMTDLLKKVDNRYLLVNLTAKRAREIADIAEANEIKLTEKSVSLALDDVINERIIPVYEEVQE